MAGKKQAKEDQKIPIENIRSDFEDIEEIEILQRSVKKTSGSSTSKQQIKGPLNLMLRPYPETVVQKLKGKGCC